MTRTWLIALLILGTLLTTESHATPWSSCASPGYLAGFDSRIPDQACDLIHQTRFSTPTGTRNLYIIRLRNSAHGDDSRWTSVIETATRTSAAKLRDFGSVGTNDITVLLADMASTRELDAHAVTREGARNACKVTFYKVDDYVSQELYTFTFAHEFFHCVQAHTWRNQTTTRGSTWAVEGTAEYFAHMVTPIAGDHNDYVGEFDTASVVKSILDMEYASVVFFFWMGQNRSPASISRLLAGLPDLSGRDRQLRALQAAVPHDEFKRFAQDALDGKIKKPNGAAVPRLEARSGRVSVNTAGDLRASGAAYSIPRYAVTFRSGKAYPLSVRNAQNQFDLSMREETQRGAWSAPPPEVSACDQDKHYILLGVSTQENGQAELSVGTPRTVNTRACCLVGVWKPNNDAVMAHTRIQRSMGPAALTCRYHSGNWTLTFNEDGTGRWQWNDYANACEMPARGQARTVEFRTTYLGAFAFSWTANETPGRASYQVTQNQSASVFRMMAGAFTGRPISTPISPLRTSGDLHYRCERNQLTLTGFAGYGGHNNDVYTREASSTRPAGR
jgi:hypothetical protein